MAILQARWMRRAVIALVIAIGWSSHASWAQGPLGASGFSALRTTHSVVPYEHVDPFSGNLLLTFTDIELPGNAGFGLRVQRVYNSKIHKDFADSPNVFRQRTWVGLGWSLHFGRILNAADEQSGATVVEMSDGSGHPLYNALPGDPDNSFGSAVTRELWRYNRFTQTLKLTNGLTYVFGHIGIGGGPDGQVRYVTEIKDPFNNRLVFQYFASNEGPTDGVKTITQHLGNGQTRVVTFTVTPLVHGYALATMQYAGRTWTYTHVETPGWPTHQLLTATSGPVAGSAWTFGYATGTPGPELLTVTGPLGGTLTYTYTNVNRPVWSDILTTRSVSSRTTGGTSVTPGTWSFAYTEGACQDTSVVTTPTRRETYRYNGVGLVNTTPGCDTAQAMGAFASWMAGSLKRTTIEVPSGVPNAWTVLQEQRYGWEPSTKVSDDTVVGAQAGCGVTQMLCTHC